MEALIYREHGLLEVGDSAEPSVTPGTELIHVRAVGICGSELESFASRSPVRVPPLIMGHEIAGVRDSDGAAVAINPIISCGHCDLCRRGRRNLCRQRSIVGIHCAGGYAERVVVPVGCARPLPDGLSFVQGAFVEPLGNAVHALRLALQHEPMPRRVGIIGAGALGVACVVAAADRGIADLMVADPSPERRSTATAAGASAVAARLEGEFDVIIDAVGAAPTRADSVNLLRPGGVTVWIGLHGPDAGFDSFDLVRQGKSVVGSFCYEDRDFDDARMLAEQVSLAWIDQVPLAHGAEAFMRLLGGPAPHIKTVMVNS
jgi:threonine dehydrogenase-like Zn-dependent dehydrogenase